MIRVLWWRRWIWRLGGNVLNVPAMQWHSLRSLESGTVLLECKEGKWEPLGRGGCDGVGVRKMKQTVSEYKSNKYR